MLMGRPGHQELGLVSLENVAANWPREVKDVREIERWLYDGVCPQDVAVWEAGSALAKSGCAWACGLWLLWACARYARCVQILGIALQRFPAVLNYLDDIWQMLVNADVLRTWTNLDGIPPFVRSYVRNRGPQEDAIEAVLSWYESRKPARGIDATTTIALTYIQRELSKLFLLPLEHVKESIANAASLAFRDEEISISEKEQSDVLFAATYLVADSTIANLEMKCTAVLVLLARWLNFWDVTMGKPEGLYARPVKSAFDDTVSAAILDNAAYREFQRGMIVQGD